MNRINLNINKDFMHNWNSPNLEITNTFGHESDKGPRASPGTDIQGGI